jgi:cytochrome c peroxidase
LQKITMPVGLRFTGIFLLLICSTLSAHSNHAKKATQKPQILAPGYQSLSYDAPLAGSYSLPIITTAGDGKVLNMQGKASRLHDFLADKYVVLSFIYTHCDDINGCPLATYVTSQVQNRLLEEKVLQNHVRFISLSFDPVNDTPEVMRNYGENFSKDDFDWQFLTTKSELELEPILNKYSQSILKDIDEDGKETGSISHILRVFLIDKKKQIRNIYSTSFLHPETVVNDIKTLALESSDSVKPDLEGAVNKPALHGAGDYKDGYENKHYETRTSSLQSRQGKQTDLIKYINKAPLGLPRIPHSAKSKITKEIIELGRQLFYDRRLSHNNTFSCAMCHIAEQGFGNNELATAVGIEGRTVRRNAPTIYNVAYAKRLFHDARESTLEQQIWGPLLAHNEMGNPSVGRVIEKIGSIEKYLVQFRNAFNGQAPDMLNIGTAIASYERAIVSANSAFDRWHFAKESNAMSKAAEQGYKLFTGKARCVACHTIERTHALFSDYKLHNTGIGYLNSMLKAPLSRKLLVAPGTWLEIDSKVIADSSETKPNDLGYYEISGKPEDRWKYKTPTLRNIALTSPYMHDGSLSNLQEVIEFYNNGGIKNDLLDPILQPLNLSSKEINYLMAFLNSLTGDNVDKLISDAFAAPVGNTN